MAARIAFRKTTDDGLLVEVLNYQGKQILLLAKDTPQRSSRQVQVLGTVIREINSPTYTWYYEYEPLSKSLAHAALNRWLLEHGYAPGVFDQFGNFRKAA